MWRTVAQILGLLVSILGWVFVACTLAMDHWRVAQLGGQGGSSVVTVAWYWSNLWRDCYEDSTAVINCVEFKVLWTVKSHIQTVLGLLLTGLSLGLVGTVLAFFGMECTHIGGDQRTKDKLLITLSAFHLVGYQLVCLVSYLPLLFPYAGVSDAAGYCLYINRVMAAHFKCNFVCSYDIGTPLYLGLVGSLLIFLGCTLNCASTRRVTHPERFVS
uniref:Claudin n=1 Tax=Myripristis murdjan TaxID=586833 RepID=A0A667Y854_9TELE